MNKMPEVAKLLGVEPGEDFKIEGDTWNPFKLTKDGLIDCEGSDRSSMLSLLLVGAESIAKSSYKPKYGDRYYYVDTDGSVRNMIWNDDIYDLGMIALGDTFRTQDEALENKEIVVGKLKETRNAQTNH